MDFIKNFTKAIESLADFQPHMFNGATEKELFALEEKLGLTLPSDFKVFYQTYNGQDDCADYLFDFFSLCTLEKIAYCWEALKVNEADFLKIEADSDDGIQNIWGCSKWMPFAASADGHFLCMDFSPAKNGTYGQVITFWYNSPERELIALSFKDFIVEYTKNIQNGVYVYQQEDGCGSIVRKDGEPMF